MNPDRWREIERLLDTAFELADEERAAFLNAECADDPDLKAEVERLIEAERDAPEFLDADAVAFAAPALDNEISEPDASPAEPGQRLGPYRILREIGHGGMSVVYLAERADGQFERRVAVKLLRHLGGTPEERIRRFKAERQILATLEHANIARVYDGGVTEGGWPYLAMEFIDGRPITEYCSVNGLGIADRLDLFDDVCEAVEHAHQRLIVHRDLKPGNIMVTDAGDLRLLDFGIAKLLDDDNDPTSGQVPVTAPGVKLLTPQYAAPEQVRGEPISTATDVYALGLLLFELLTDSRPYDVTGRSATEVERIVCEQGVPRPSTMTASLEGDLDTIILKTLRKNPAERYGSVPELRADLDRHRNGQPVEARPLTAGYRIRKFVQRHRIGVALAALIAVMLVSFAVVSLLQQRETEHQRDQARLEARKSAEVTDFLLSLFEAGDPSEALGETPSALDLLERGLERANRLQSQPEVRAEILTVIGRAYRGLGEFTRADSTIRMALVARRESGNQPAGKELLAKTTGELAVIATDLADYPAADSLFREALAQMPPTADDSLFAILNNDYAFLMQRRGDLAAAESLHAVALDLRKRRAADRQDLSVAQSLNNLAQTEHQLGRYQTADSLYLESLAIRRALLPELHPSLANTIGSLAANREMLGDYAAADSLYRIALESQRRVLGPDHPQVAGTAMLLANLLIGQAEYDRAESLHREVLETRRRTLGPDHPDVGESIFSLAYLNSRRGDYPESARLYQEAIDLWLPRLGAAHPYITLTYNNLARVLANQGRWEESVRMNREVLRRNEATYGPESPQVAVSLGNLGDALIETGEFVEADRQITRSLDIRRALFGEENTGTADSYALLAKLRLRQGRFMESVEKGLQSLEIRRQVHGPYHPRVAYSLHGLAMASWRLGDVDAAARYFEEGLAIRLDALGPDHPESELLHTDYLDFCEETDRDPIEFG